MILINNSINTLEITVPYASTGMQVTTMFTDSTSGLIAISDNTWCEAKIIRGYTDETNYYQTWFISIFENNTEDMRDGLITFRGTNNRGIQEENLVTVTQGYHTTEVIPVWKDKYFFYDNESLEFSIYNNDREIFKGLAKMQPGSDGCYINISKIVRDYLSSNIGNEFTDVDELESNIHTGAYQLFDVRVNGKTIVTYQYINDWSYDNTVKYSTQMPTSLNCPINGHADPRMIIPYTYWCADAYDQDFYKDEDYITTATWENNVIGGAFFNTSWIGKGHTLSDGSNRFTYYVDYCGDYCLYYRNRHNGYDAFLIEGNVKQTDSFNRISMSKSFNNTTLDFENATYNNEITSGYELKTGWLNDREAERLSTHLASSNEVYLHNLKEDKIMPVVLSITSVDYKTYKNQGRQLVSYTLTCNCSQKKHIQ